MALPTRPKLLVLVILDQFRPDYLDSAANSFAPGGFRRLLEKGAYFPDCRHLASTFPASSIATLATGAWPAQHGIAADSWYDRSIRKPVPATDDALLATTLAAQVDALPGARVTVVSLNDAHGALFAGTPDARLFWIDDNGQFSTLPDPPDWLAAFNAARNPDSLHDARWLALGARPDAPALRTLNFSPERPAEFLALYKSSYYAQDVQFDLALELIAREKMGQTGTFEFLCILAGSTGLLGYETGAVSPLMRQLTLRLDRQIESLLNQLTKAPGEKNFSLVVAGAHGAPPVRTARRPSPPPSLATAWPSAAKPWRRPWIATSTPPAAAAWRNTCIPSCTWIAAASAIPSPSARPPPAPPWSIPPSPATSPPGEPAPPTMSGSAASATASTPSARATSFSPTTPSMWRTSRRAAASPTARSTTTMCACR
ncbi:hypothetical protein SBA4_5770005 [Candidatus Sulfopaludibacter sp. SbA4]|nr:hypothetical protein SBA4_5770005 [Candidatus Sulfopaludibacter sp. SbA4]